MRQKIAQDARVVGVKLVPAEVMLGIKPNLWRAAQPPIPIQIALIGVGIDRIGPLAVLVVVAAIRTLGPNQRTHLAGLDPFSRLVILGIPTELRAEHKRPPRPLDGVVNA